MPAFSREQWHNCHFSRWNSCTCATPCGRFLRECLCHCSHSNAHMPPDAGSPENGYMYYRSRRDGSNTRTYICLCSRYVLCCTHTSRRTIHKPAPFGGGGGVAADDEPSRGHTGVASALRQLSMARAQCASLRRTILGSRLLGPSYLALRTYCTLPTCRTRVTYLHPWQRNGSRSLTVPPMLAGSTGARMLRRSAGRQSWA